MADISAIETIWEIRVIRSDVGSVNGLTGCTFAISPVSEEANPKKTYDEDASDPSEVTTLVFLSYDIQNSVYRHACVQTVPQPLH